MANIGDIPFAVRRGVSLKAYSTLRAGGPAEGLAFADSADELSSLAEFCQQNEVHLTLLGHGSNVLPSDDGVPGLVAINRAKRIEVRDDGEVLADCGCAFQELFLKTAQRGLSGLEFAVGIPGTLGGALVSNAGAYRSNISSSLMELEVVMDGRRQWIPPERMGFAYRDSILRRSDPPAISMIRVRLKLNHDDPKAVYDRAREFQRQRISKQPAPASAGSFFKNVNDKRLAESFPNLPQAMKESGVVPGGFLIESAGLKGRRLGGAVLGPRHANFIVNVGGATATEIRDLAELAKNAVWERFAVRLEEEVLYLGDWSRYASA